uniref:FYVE-type domain-containing protein n=1 Tax=Strigamia maritima TaxID=126957 RepID=T1J9R9_STRMM
MDKYTVDLDAVLDEFEQNEDNADQITAVHHPNPISINNIDEPSLPHIPPINNHKSSGFDYPFEPMEKLDLAEADFGAPFKLLTRDLPSPIEKSIPNGTNANIPENNALTAETIASNLEKEKHSDARNEEIAPKDTNKTSLVQNNLISLNKNLPKINNGDRCQNGVEENNKISEIGAGEAPNNINVSKMEETGLEFVKLVGFTDVQMSESELDDHFKNAELELAMEASVSPKAKSNDESSSSEEYFSPLAELKSPHIPLDREDGGKKRDDVEVKKVEDDVASDKLVNEEAEEVVEDEMMDGGAGAQTKMQRPTCLMLSGVEPSLASVDALLDFPTPANPNGNYLHETSLLDDSRMSTTDDNACIDAWKEDETVSTTTPDWHGAEDFQLGKMAPFWIPDSEAPLCMHCNVKFTVLKRRHHCRACGQVLCSQCCGAKAKLPFMENREARVCSQCHLQLKKAESPSAGSFLPSAPLMSPSLQPISNRPNPNNPIEYCSTISPLQQAKASPQVPLPTIMVPVGVLKREGSKTKGAGEPKQVMFSDGIRPGGDLTELDEVEEPRPLYRRPGRVQKKIERNVDGSLSEGSPEHLTRLPELPLHLSNYVPEEEMRYPPVIFTDENGLESVDVYPDLMLIYEKLIDLNEPPIKFAINKNLFVFVKIVQLNCCLGKLCWCFSTKGMCNVAQEEMMIVLECLPDEKEIAKDIFYHFSTVYDDASHGIVISHLSCSIFNHAFLSSRDHGGFLYIKPTTQCLKQLPVPDCNFLVGVLLQKWEIPWAKVFPLRLMLRLGAEFSCYPCPILSCRFRKPVFYEIGHTIMNILADFRNYQYTLPNIRGMKIHLEDKKTRIKFPRNRYDDVMRALNNSNDHVLALGTIGASFVVFSGALKSTSGFVAKLSVVEDGVMVQIPPDKMAELRQSLREMNDMALNCGPIDAETHEEVVFVQWVDDDKEFNVGVKSPIDNMAMDGIQSIRIHGGTDYAGERWLIRWTEVFLIQTDELINSRRSEPVNISRLSEKLAQAFCMALTSHLESLKVSNMTKLGLRATVDTENVGYEVGSLSDKLPAVYMNDLDSNLIPVIHRAVSTTQEGPVTLELIFHVLEQ